MEPVRRSKREKAGARMNDATLRLPVQLKRTVAIWLVFCGYFFYDLPARPLGLALNVTDKVVMAAFQLLRDIDGEREIRQVAQVLQAFVRREWPRLRHRFRDDVEKFALKFFLPARDVAYWLQDHPDDWAFLPYEDGGPVMERLILMEALEDSISAQVARQQHGVCALCGMELFPGLLRWRELSDDECRFKPPMRPPEHNNVHVVRISIYRDKERVSVCSSCKTRDPARPVPMLDPIPKEVLAVPTAFRHYLSALSLWMKREHGPGFSKVIGMTSCASRALSLKHQTSTLGIFLSSIRPDELLRNNVAEGERITGLLRDALRALIDGGCLVLRHLFSMYELGMSSVAMADKAPLADDATGQYASLLQRKTAGPAQILMPDYDLPQEDASIPESERVIGVQQSRPAPLLPTSTETGSGNSSSSEAVSIHVAILSGDPGAAKAVAADAEDKMDFATMQDVHFLEKLFPWLFPLSRGGFSKPASTWGWSIGHFLKWAVLNQDHRFRNCAEFVFAVLDRKFAEMIIGANSNTGGTYKQTHERGAPTVREAQDFFQRFSWLPPSIPGSESYFKAKRRTLFAIRAFKKREASVFVTMTFNPHWPEVVDMVARNGGGVYWQYPGDCAIIFHNRLRQVADCLWGKKSVFGLEGAVEEYWMRVEEQGRWGGLHVHILLWLSVNAEANLHNVVWSKMPPVGHPVRPLVQQLHLHKHTPDYCGGEGRCRFGYPQPQHEEAVWHVDDLPPSKATFLKASNGKRAFQRVLYKRGPDDINVVPYVPELLARWNGQCNVEVVLQAGSKTKKSDKRTSHGGTENLRNYCAASPLYNYASKGDASLKFKKLTESQKYANFRVLTSMMAAYIALQCPLAVSSRTSLYIPTGPCDQRRRKLLPKKLQPKDANATAEFADGLIDKYVQRPPAMHGVSFLHFCAWFDMERAKAGPATKPSDDQDDDFNEGQADENEHQAEKNDAVDEELANEEDEMVALPPPATAKKTDSDGDILFSQKVKELGGMDQYLRAVQSAWGTVDTGFDFETCAFSRVFTAGTTFTSTSGKLRFRLRRSFKLVSWTFSSPGEGEPFYHMFAMLAFCFTGPDLPTTEMKEAFPQSETPFEDFCRQHFPGVFPARGTVELAEQLMALQRADASRAGVSARRVATSASAQLTTMAVNVMDARGTDAAMRFAERLLQSALASGDAIQEKAATTLLSQLQWRLTAPPLNVDQHAVFVRVVDAVTQQTPLTMCTLGGGGTGKSLLIRHVVFELTVRWKKTIVVAATTGTAAAALGGMTMHAVFGFNIYLKGDLQPGTAKWYQLGQFDLLICDECSMMSSKMFEAASDALTLVRGAPEDESVFGGGASVWLLGDFKQLDAVDTQEDRVTVRPLPGEKAEALAPFLFESALFELFEITFLTINERARNDPLFAHVLDHASRGELDAFDEQILRSRLCASLISEGDSRWAATTAGDTPHMISQTASDSRNFFFAARVDGPAMRLEHNCRMLCHHGDFAACAGPLRPFAVLTGRKTVRDLVNNQALYYYPTGLSTVEGQPPPDWRNAPVRDYVAVDCAQADFAQGVKPPSVDDPQQIAAMSKVSQYPRQLRLKPGMPVLIVRNYDLERQICNGSRALFLDDSTEGANPNKPSTLLRIRLQHSGEEELLKRELDRGEKAKMVRSQFAVIPAFAASVHKAQGISENHIMTSLGVTRTPEGDIDQTTLQDMFAPSQSYVALSRSRTLRGVHLLAFDRAAVHVHAEVLKFYKDANAPPTTSVYMRADHDGNERLPFTTWRYQLRNFSVPDTSTKKRPRSVPASPPSSDDEADEEVPFALKLHQTRERLLYAVSKPSPRKRTKVVVVDIPEERRSQPRMLPKFNMQRPGPFASLLQPQDLNTQEHNLRNDDNNNFDVQELSSQERAELIANEYDRAQQRIAAETARALGEQLNQEDHAERIAVEAERRAHRIAAYVNGSHRNLNPVFDDDILPEKLAGGVGRNFDSLRRDSTKLFNFTVNAYSAVLRSFLLNGMNNRLAILGVDFLGYITLDADIIDACQQWLAKFQYVLIPTLLGEHFFLYCVFRYANGTAQVLGFDSLVGPDGNCIASHYFEKIVTDLALPSDTPYRMHPCPQQPNGTDCGVYTMFNLRVLFGVLSRWHENGNEDTFPIRSLRPLNVRHDTPSNFAHTFAFRQHFAEELLDEVLSYLPVFDPQLYMN